MSYLPDPNYGGRNYYEAEKQTRLYEDKSDLTDLAKNVCETNTVASRRLYLFDNVNLPAAINWLAVIMLVQEGDWVHANMSLYRDSDGTREWQTAALGRELRLWPAVSA